MRSWLFLGLLAFVLPAGQALAQDELRIPAFTAYLTPNTEAAPVSDSGVSGWNSKDAILWGGSIPAGRLHAAVVLSIPGGATTTVKLTIASQSREATLTGADESLTADFGDFEIAQGGYQTIQLAGVAKTAKCFGDVRELVLSGPAAKDAFFNLLPRRNAASVHLGFPIPDKAEAVCFYNELTAREDPVATYYEACGFHRGYFGMQVNSPTERRIIFSVWDSGNEAVDRGKVAETNRVKLLAKGDGVVAGDFGNEGTGGHSHLVYPWKTAETQRFLVTAKVDGDATIYSGYFYFNDRKKWDLIATFRAPHDGKLLHGLYSFNENFGGDNGHLRRLCEFGNQWIKTPGGKWIELTTARFTHDPTGGKSRRDYGAGVTSDGRFYLSNGGFIAEPIERGKRILRPAGGGNPAGGGISADRLRPALTF